MNNSFLPVDYKLPSTPSNYMRFEDGINSFRVLSPAVTGYVYFNSDNKPVRSKQIVNAPKNIKKDGKVRPFWAFVVWNNNAMRIQILELTQKTVMESMLAIVNNPKWGDPKNYDIAIKIS